MAMATWLSCAGHAKTPPNMASVLTPTKGMIIMTPAQNQRFIDYVQRTSRPEVQEQRCKLLSALTGWTCKTARELTASIQGNTNTRKWISEAMQVGEIVRREDGVLILPPPETGSRVDRAVTTWCDAGLELRRALLAAELPMGVGDGIRQAEARIIA